MKLLFRFRKSYSCRVSWHYFPKYSIIFPFGKKKMHGKKENCVYGIGIVKGGVVNWVEKTH